MRTKALLGMAALAASTIATMAATPVYSLNIVGYANVPIVASKSSLLCNPFDLDGTNNAQNVLTLAPLDDNGGIPVGTLGSFALLLWTNNNSYVSVFYESDFTSNITGPNSGNPGGATNGWASNGFGTLAAAPPNLPPGVGFFIQNAASQAATNVFVGNVFPGPGHTNSINIPASVSSLVASMLPVGGQLPNDGNYTGLAGPISNLQLPLSPLDDNGGIPAGTLGSFALLKWTNNNSYASVFYESDFTSNITGPNSGNPGGGTNGWASNGFGTKAVAAPNIAVGEGFFIQNANTAPATWSQGLTNGF